MRGYRQIMNNPLLDKYEQTMKTVRECKTADAASEIEAGKAYQNMVKAGLAMQIKKKYRGR